MKADSLPDELKAKIRNWLVSFHHLDPRHKILTFFNQVASDGADNFCEDNEDYDYNPNVPKRKFTHIEKLLKDAFHTTSILTVWRPCSNDAMRKMMEGSGVGKGLDIKGKSAQKGLLSAFVPFMQIHEEDHKDKIQKITRKARLRVYYSSLQARAAVMDELEPLGNDYMEFDPDKVIYGDMVKLDKYAKQNLYGLELSQRLFWKGYVIDQDITRGEDTQTGRPSMPGFQDANLKTLKTACHAVPNPSPMPVVFQYDKDNPMSPQHLVMAYEENGTVTPVVSDFDGFLLGWRREALWFGCNLPRDQEHLMIWCVDHIEQILDSGPSADTWTVRWLEILKEEASKDFHPVIPEYGFGDPKSYGIMERAALQLIDTGAVRHGSECFNYYFPQEIDDTFLLISDTLKPVPWRYLNVEELQALLSQRVKDGFVFPLNPKWILCDPGWKKLYDELMTSDALYAEYTKDVWYPPFSGVREKIERIYKKHPKGFQRPGARRPSEIKPQEYSPLRQNLDEGNTLSGNAAFDLAELEFENFKKRNSKKALSLGDLPEAASSSDDSDDDDDGRGSFVTARGSMSPFRDSTSSAASKSDFRREALMSQRSNNDGNTTNNNDDSKREIRRAAMTKLKESVNNTRVGR